MEGTVNDNGGGSMGWVTARELGRRISEVLNRIELDGQTVVVTRFGYPAALMVPISDVSQGVQAAQARLQASTEGVSASHGRPHAGAESNDESDAGDEGLEFELDPLQQKVLTAVAERAGDPWKPHKIDEPWLRIAPALGRLELSGLVIRDVGGYRITRKGTRLAGGQPPR